VRNSRLNEEAFYEFIYMGRIFGNKTYDRDTAFLNAASIMRYECSAEKLTIAKYWDPGSSGSGITGEERSRKLAFLIKQSLTRLTSDSKRYGLLLSGGLDSRAVLAASEKPLICLTTCEYENNEYLVARQLSQKKGYEHLFIKKPDKYYFDIIEEGTYLGGAMNDYCHAHFLNIKETVKDKIDVCFHGYGFDFLLRGKYLPVATHRLLESLTCKRKIMPLSSLRGDIAGIFIDNISYRLKSVDPLLLVKRGCRTKMQEALRCGIEENLAEAKRLFDDPYKWWDYCCFHNISRHYSWLNLTSIRASTEERAVAFDNDLFDFYWSLDAPSRINDDLFVNTIRLLDPSMYSIRYANTNLRLDDSPFMTASKTILNRILKEFRLNRVFKRSLARPKARERSWPIDADLIRGRADMRGLVQGLASSKYLENMQFLDMDRVSSCVNEHLQKKADHTRLIMCLITLDTFFKFTDG
jgi:asparagine synthase (glutamine-hydrolysing)